ncbi:MAG: alpha/beta hydrolase [Phenylobacterium sp.]|jgi:acetyl esterase|uniref:alpha/beta hydrolase n=1 Tax=Phenylobacterium sp. TaxID=1871053 RepID=UPI001B6CD4C5|nr:alpha/beta hydrolase [Phenylobacterium sp.]MBP7648283.1 alpha/beta hydrolase [Phenylobacterium sp.]MBP7814822.1 alpha/beta hydrolase [Phenylobacterium sp.]MBP9753365.1 alpha/beta hydrolase [Phenylobacterium sp.]MDP1600176.1 alpha/beta hydrolase [Phenylobacterium sp.]MDP3593573.1 alpha/beta hydrolase [Phenylobacterium sp.]
MDVAIRDMLDRQAVAAASQPRPVAGTIPPEQMRAGYRAQRQGVNLSAPKDVRAFDLQVAGGADLIPARLYVPEGCADPSAALIYFHGGGFVVGDLESHDGHCRRLASYAGLRVLAVDYRLAPEHPFPAAHDDALAATVWAFDHADEIGVDPTKIAIGGCSAGGNLAASVALDLRDDADRRLAFQLLLYPVTWPASETASRRDLDGPVLTKAGLAWFEEVLAAKSHPDAARTYLHLQDRLIGAPQALVVTAGYDPLKDEGEAYVERLVADGVVAEHLAFPELIHDFYLLGDVSPAVEAAAQETAARLRAALA